MEGKSAVFRIVSRRSTFVLRLTRSFVNTFAYLADICWTNERFFNLFIRYVGRVIVRVWPFHENQSVDGCR